jgi:hypothetical protein
MASFPPAGGPRLADFFHGLAIQTRWLAGHPVIWQTGQQDGLDEAQPAHHTHCSAFAAAAALYLDIYLLRPPHHGPLQLANAQTAWLAGDGSYPGPTAAASGWTALGRSGDDGALEAAQALANAGRLVLACYAATPPTPGHIALLRPRHDGSSAIPDDGPELIMAGARNYAEVSMRLAFSNHPAAWPDNIALFAHDTVLQPGGEA